PGHYSPGSGAKDIIDEVTEARKIVNRIVRLLQNVDIGVTHIEDNISKTQEENLEYLIAQHNNTTRKLDVSVHFNSTSGRHDTNIGTEVLYVSDKMKAFASQISKAISDASGLRNRGGKKQATVDVSLYQNYFEEICIAITNELIQYVKPGHIPIDSKSAQRNQEETNSNELNSTLKGTLSLQNFTGPTLITRLEEILTNKQKIKQMLEKGIKDQAIQPIWLDKLNNGTLTT
ncbi:hypothetical protein RhiirA1_484177, partial [Rhizophagus irregularis]